MQKNDSGKLRKQAQMYFENRNYNDEINLQ